MLGKPRIRLNNLKTSLIFPCLDLNPIIDSINLTALEFNTHNDTVKYSTGSGCSKLTTSLVNVSLKFQTLISQIFQYFLSKKI